MGETEQSNGHTAGAFQRFFHSEVSGSIVLLASVIAGAWGYLKLSRTLPKTESVENGE